MSQIKGKQIKDNTLDLTKIRGGSKTLPADASLGTLKTVFTNGSDFVTKTYVDNLSTDATALDGSGLIANAGKLDVNVGSGLEIATDKVTVKASDTTISVAAGGISVNTATIASTLKGTTATTGLTNSGSNLAISYSDAATSLKGAGLSSTLVSGKLTIGAGSGITVNTNDVAVDYATVASTLKGVTATTGLTNSGNTLAVDYTTVASGLKSNGLVASSGKLSVGAGTGITVNASDVAVDFTTVASNLKGNGMTATSGKLNVIAGTGIAVNANDVALNISAYTTSTVISVESTHTSGATYRTTQGNLNLITGTSHNVVITGRDARYTADYSATYTDRSLVDKQYVDSLASGLDPKASVKHATNKVLTGLTYTVTGGGTFTKGSAITMADIDTAGGTLVVGDRVLVKDQTDAKQNGIYVLATTTTLVRSSDMDGNPTTEVSAGNFTFVETGSFANMGFVVQGSGNLTVNTDTIVWVQFSGAGQVTAGSGLSKSGNELRFLPNANTAGAGLVHGDTGGHGFISVGAGAGISVTADAVAVALDANSGLQTTSGLKVVAGAGISVGANVAVSLDTNSGLQTTSGLKIVAGNGISVGANVGINLGTSSGLSTTSGLVINLATTSGLSTTSGLAVVAESAKGISISAAGLSVNASNLAGNGLSGTGNTLTVGAGTGIVVGSTNVGIIKPTAVQQSVTPLAVAANATATTGITLGSTPAGVLRIAINGMIAKLGDGVKTDTFFFSNDAGATARTFANIASGDTLYFNGVAAGFELETDDLISVVTVA
jgi:hypothetical protein